MPQMIRLTGIEARGRHGASPGERSEPQTFTVDLEVVVEAEEDDLASTADYRELVVATRRAIEEQSHGLLETIAERVAASVATVPGVLSCRAVVHKPAAAGRLGLTDVSAQATAARLPT